MNDLVFVENGFDRGLYVRVDARSNEGNWGDYFRKITEPLKLKHCGILDKEEAYSRCEDRNHGVDLAEKYGHIHREPRA